MTVKLIFFYEYIIIRGYFPVAEFPLSVLILQRIMSSNAAYGTVMAKIDTTESECTFLFFRHLD